MDAMNGVGFGLDHSSPCTYRKVLWVGNAFSLLESSIAETTGIAVWDTRAYSACYHQEGKETKMPSGSFSSSQCRVGKPYPTLASRAVATGWKRAEATQQVSYATPVLFPSLFVAKVGKLQVAQILSPAFPDTGGQCLQPLSIPIRFREDPTGLRGPSPPKFIATEALTAPKVERYILLALFWLRNTPSLWSNHRDTLQGQLLYNKQALRPDKQRHKNKKKQTKTRLMISWKDYAFRTKGSHKHSQISMARW